MLPLLSALTLARLLITFSPESGDGGLGNIAMVIVLFIRNLVAIVFCNFFQEVYRHAFSTKCYQ